MKGPVLKDALRRVFLHEAQTFHDDLVESMAIEALSGLSETAEAFYQAALHQAAFALGDECVIDGKVVDEYAHTPVAQRLAVIADIRESLRYVQPPDASALYWACVHTSGLISEAVRAVEHGDASDIAIELFRRSMYERMRQLIHQALVDSLESDALASSIASFLSVKTVYEALLELIDSVCAGVRSEMPAGESDVH